MTTAVETHALSKSFGKVIALDKLDLTVGQGEVFGYLGPNGSGKTVTIRLLLNLLHPTFGTARIFGIDVQKDPIGAHRTLAYVPGETSLWPSLTGMETLYLLGRVQGKCDEKYRDELIERFDLDPSKKVRAYSKGNKQKICLIAALSSRAQLLILDEPTSGLDPLMERQFARCVNEAKDNGQTVFLSSHILSEVEQLCDRVGILRTGHLVEVGTLAEMRHLSSLKVAATFPTTPPNVTGVAGVSNVEVVGNSLSCHVKGTIEPLLKVLSDSGAINLLSREPSLEEIFLAHYGPTSSAESPA